jgi:Bacterial Ig domain
MPNSNHNFSKLLVTSLVVITTASFFYTPLTYAAGCTAGTRPGATNFITHGNFDQVEAATPNSPGTQGLTGTPGVLYPNNNFYSQARNFGHDIYPASLGYNSFSLQVGSVIAPFPFYPSYINQVTLPADPANNVAATNTWFYSNGNSLYGGEYLTWGQNITGLTAGRTYDFAAYVSNVIDVPFTPGTVEPNIALKTGGTTGLPNGTTITGPTIISRAPSTDGWQRVESTFVPATTSLNIKFVNSAAGEAGDDFALTGLSLTSCVPYIALAQQAGTPVVQPGNSYKVPMTYTLKNTSSNTNTAYDITNANIIANLSSIFGADLVSVSPITSSAALIVPNPSFNGTTNTNLLSSGQTLPANSSVTITFDVILKNLNGNTYSSSTQATGLDIDLATLADTSTNGTNVDPNADGSPLDNSTPTPITIPATAITVDDLKTTTTNTPITYNPLANDTLPTGTTITKINTTSISAGQSVTIPNGSVKLNLDGTLTFTPNTDFSGTLSFSYTVTTPGAIQVMSTETITITPNPATPSTLIRTGGQTIQGLALFSGIAMIFAVIVALLKFKK